MPLEALYSLMKENVQLGPSKEAPDGPNEGRNVINGESSIATGQNIRLVTAEYFKDLSMRYLDFVLWSCHTRRLRTKPRRTTKTLTRGVRSRGFHSCHERNLLRSTAQSSHSSRMTMSSSTFSTSLLAIAPHTSMLNIIHLRSGW
jgi:hypothetical protein